MRRLAPLGALCALAAVAAAPAGATSECRGLRTCVPVAGPWVLATTSAQVQYQLACPKRFLVGGLDAEVSNRAVEVGFVGALGSPVSPGVTTSTSALFLGQLVRGTDAAASFRPHIGCIPSAGGGQRVPTAFAPGRPAMPQSVRFAVVRGAHRYAARCPSGQQLVSYTHALGFYTAAPPTLALVHAVHATFVVGAGAVHVTVAGALALSGTRAELQLDLLCVAGR
ncbi:MAG: hypothetical protein ACYDCH_04290 [Gaiellaceae bacterium]